MYKRFMKYFYKVYKNMFARKDLEQMKIQELKTLVYSYGIDRSDVMGSGADGSLLKKDYVYLIDTYIKNHKKEVVIEETTKQLPIKPVQQIKCADPHMTNLKLYKSCDDNKICNVNTGKCIANNNKNRKNKASIMIGSKLYVGNQIYIDMLQKIIDKQHRSCDVLSFLSIYGHLINRIIIFLYPNMDPQHCLLKINNLVKVESRCRTTADSIVYALTGGDFNKFNLIQKNNLTLNYILERLLISNLIVISIPSDNKFGGHILIIVRSGDIYYIIQSYIFEYTINITIATDIQVILYISKYLKIFSTKNWNNNDTLLWKCLTGVDIPIYNNKKPNIFIYWSPVTFVADNEHCQVHVKKLLEDAVGKINKIKEVPDNINNLDKYITKRQHLEISFADIMNLTDNKYKNSIYKVENDIENLLDELQSYYHIIVDYNHLTEDGCLHV